MRKSALAWNSGCPIPDELRRRFWAKVKKTSGCWHWAGKRFGVTQYGSFTLCVQSWRGPAWRPEAAHRLAYELIKGPIPPRMHVLHSCDVRWCVNPDHLRVGSDADNKADAVARHRMRSGSRHPAARLSEGKVVSLRQRYAHGETMEGLAQDANINYQTLWSMLKGHTWRHAEGPIADSRKLNCKVSIQQVNQIRELHRAGWSLAVLGKKFGLSKHGIWSITSRKTWRHLP